MRYAQVRLTDEQFIEVKKAALDAKMTLEQFIESSLFEKLFADAVKVVKEDGK